MDKPIIPQDEYLRRAVKIFRTREFAPRLNGRIERAYDLALSGHVRAQGHGTYIVLGQTTTKAYAVRVFGAPRCSCECPDNVREEYCKHVVAVLLAEKAESDRRFDDERFIIEHDERYQQEYLACHPEG